MRLFARVVLVISLTAGPFVTAAADEAQNEAVARRFYTEFNTHNLDGLDEFVAADIIDHSPSPDQKPGLQGYKAAVAGFFAASSDIKVEIELVIAKGDYVTVASTLKGTHTGPLLGVPATNKPLESRAIDIWRVKDGKLVESWHAENLLPILFTIGALGGK